MSRLAAVFKICWRYQIFFERSNHPKTLPDNRKI